MTEVKDVTPETNVQESPKPLFEKKKPGAKMIDQFGNLEKRRRKVDFFGVSDICLPPVTRKTIATYRMLGMDQIDRSTNQPVEPVDVLLPGSYVFYDRGEQDLTNKSKFIKNLSRPEIKKDTLTGKQIIDDDLIQEIMFIRGVLRVDTDKQPNLYFFIELHPLNKSNPNRNFDVNPMFERIDLNQTRSMAFKLAEQDLAFEAEDAVRKMEKSADVIGYATSGGVPTMENGKPRAITAIKSDLRVRARNNPKWFFSLGNNLKAGVRLNVLDALHWGLIENDVSRKVFHNPVSGGSIHTWLVGEDPVESLVNFYVTEEGQEQYNALVNMVEYWK